MRSLRRTVVGTVVSAKMQKTVVVQTERLVQHPKYKKYVRRRTKLYA
ncbi:MAG: 30S ribosomal protein S17, partial [candidate division WOR-3 bacterium]